MKTSLTWCVVAVAVIGMVSAGCHTAIPTQEFRTSGLSIVCADSEYMGALLSKRVPHDPFAPYCTAYIDVQQRVLYVPWSKEKDINGNPLPDFTALGHELWHAVAGWWHSGTIFFSKKSAPSPALPLSSVNH